MADERATNLIALYDSEWSRSANFKTLYQNTADLIFPRENQITRVTYPGRDKSTDIVDPTGVMASIEMTSGLSINLFPPGQRFYNVVMSDRTLNELEPVKQALGRITEISHEKRANSNFMLQANETLRSISVFGTGNLYSEWVPGIGLNYRDYDIGQYLIMENNKGRIDTVMIKFPYTARQAVQEWGDEAGKSVLEAMGDVDKKKESDIFWFIRFSRPREKRNPSLTDPLNMPYEAIDVSVKDKVVVFEGGNPEFPYAVPRWTKSSNEVWGRGQGTFALPTVRVLQVMKKDLKECGNKWNNPPREILESFEGEVKVFPGALNYVTETGSIKAIDEGVRGNFPISKDILEMEQDLVKKMFFNDVFVQLRDLKGDRRTTLEIRERLVEGLQRLGPPIGRLQEEWLTPLVTRDIMLLFRNGELPPLPPEMQGKSFKIEYIGRLAMELKSQQARGFQQWVGAGIEMNAVFPVTDNIDFDGGYRRLGETLGVSVEDMNSSDEVEEKREARQAQQDAQQAAEMAEMAGKAYPGATKAPESGSPAEALMEV
jgi:hypothetical protein